MAEAAEVHPAALVTVKVMLPEAKPLRVVVEPVPLMLPGLMVHVPDVGRLYNTTPPVVTVQVGDVIVPTAGAIGVAG